MLGPELCRFSCGINRQLDLGARIELQCLTCFLRDQYPSKLIYREHHKTNIWQNNFVFCQKVARARLVVSRVLHNIWVSYGLTGGDREDQLIGIVGEVADAAL